MQCPICLDDLRQSVIFSCHHACCSPCYIASEITTCPYCRHPITTTQPAPWLDSTSSYLEQTNEKEFDKRESEIVDPRGYMLLDQAHRIRGRCLPIVSCVDKIIAMQEEETQKLDYVLQVKIKALQQEYEAKVQQIQGKVNQLLTQDEMEVKRQEYHNQGLEHLAITCQALSTRSTEVLNQAIPMYQGRIDSILFEWPLGLTPTPRLNSLNTLKSLDSTNVTGPSNVIVLDDLIISMPYKLYTYVPEVNQFVYADGKFLCLGAHRTKCEHIWSIKVANNIYVMSGKGLYNHTISEYDTKLNLLRVLTYGRVIVDFILDQSQGEVIPIYASNHPSGLGSMFTYKNKEYYIGRPKKIELSNGNIHMTDCIKMAVYKDVHIHSCSDFLIHQGQIYFIRTYHDNTQLSSIPNPQFTQSSTQSSNSQATQSSNSWFTQSQEPQFTKNSDSGKQGLLAGIHEGDSRSFKCNVEIDNIIGTKHLDFNVSDTFYFPAYGKFYPGAKNTIIYCLDGYSQIFTIG